MVSSSRFAIGIAATWLASTSAYAQSAKTMPSEFECPATELRLDTKIPKLTTQDQDSLNICYASATATILQMIDPEHRAVSALDLSMQTYKDDVTESGVAIAYDATAGKKQMFNEVGDTCKALKYAMKNSVCPKDLSFLENSDLNVYEEAYKRQKQILESEAFKAKHSNNPFGPPGSEGKQSGNLFGQDHSYESIDENGNVTITAASKSTETVDPVRKQAEVLYQLGKIHDDLKAGKLKQSDLYLAFQKDAPALLELYRMNGSGGKTSYSFEKLDHKLKQQCSNPTTKDLYTQLSTIAGGFKKMDAEQQFEEFLKKIKNPKVDLILGAVSPACLEEKFRFQYLTKYGCLPREKPKNEAELSKILLKSLNSKGRNYLELSICSALLKNQNYKPGANCKSFDAGPHGVVLIGARKSPDQKSCQFLVQNSWGKRCNIQKNCKDGKTWIDSKTLFDSLNDYSEISKDLVEVNK